MLTHHRTTKSRARPHAFGRNLVERGHEVTMITTADTRRIGITERDWDGVRTIETPDLLWGSARSGWDAWGLLNRVWLLAGEPHKYDLVHCFETRPATIYPALFYAVRHQVPIVMDWNDWWGRGGLIEVNRPRWWRAVAGDFETFYEEHFRHLADGTTTISHPLARRAEELGVASNSICVVPGGVDTKLFRPIAKGTCREKLGIGREREVVCFSSLDSHLDLELLLPAVGQLVGVHPEVLLMITGTVASKIRALISAHGLQNRAILPGLVAYEELPFYLGCADVFVMPLPDTVYNRARWPNKIGEYMSMGIPTVSNPIGDVQALFENCGVGLLCPYTSDGFASSIERLLSDSRLAAELGRSAREVAVQHYDWGILIRRVEDLYSEVLASFGGAQPNRVRPPRTRAGKLPAVSPYEDTSTRRNCQL